MKLVKPTIVDPNPSEQVKVSIKQNQKKNQTSWWKIYLWMMKGLISIKDTFINKFWHSNGIKKIRSKFTLLKQQVVTPIVAEDETTVPYRVFLIWLLDTVNYGIVFWLILLPWTMNPLWALSAALIRWFTLDYKKDWKVT